jgi:putative aldouronate transport system permease protein
MQRKSLRQIAKNQRYLMMMSLPFFIHIVIFQYIPIWGWTMAFQDFKPTLNFFGQEWVGLRHFIALFTDAEFPRIMRNTLAMSSINLVLGTTASIVLALSLNEVRNMMFKRTVQTISYLPHFVSWVVAANIVLTILASDGALNTLLVSLGIVDEPIIFMGRPKLFWWIIGFSNVWKGVGWGAIVYLAAIAGISPELYEAADIDGAGRIAKIRHITLPGIRTTIIVLLIINIGWIMNAGFEQPFLLQNTLVKDYSTNIDIFVLERGMGMGRYSFSTAAGIFKSVVSLVMVLGANALAKRFGQERLV